MDHNTRIVISADAKGVQDTTTQLEKLGKVDKNNADQFKKHHEELKKQHHESFDLNTKLSRSLVELGEGVVAAFAVEHVIEFGIEAVKAYSEIQEATNKLKFAVISINGGTEESFNRLVEQAESTSKKLKNLYTSKDIMGSQTQLSNFGISGQMIEGLTPRIIDIAAAKNITLAEATEKTIMAMNGQTKGLRDIGVSFKDTGSKTENYNKLLQQTEKLQGSAADRGHTLAGRIDEIKNNFEVSKEVIGEFIQRGFDVVDFFTNAIGQTHDFTEELELLNKKFPELSKTLKNLSEHAADFRLSAAKDMGDEAAILKYTEEAKYEAINNFTHDVGKLKDEEIEKEIQRLEKQEEINKTKKGGNDLLNKALQEGFDENGKKNNKVNLETRLNGEKQIEILKDQLRARRAIDNDDTEQGKERKKAAYDALLKMQEQFYKDLEAIRLKDAEDNDKYNIELITNEADKKTAVQESAFRKEQEEFKKREEKLSEIIQKGKQDQRIKARIELDKLFIDEELAQKAHEKKLSDIQLDAHKKQEEENIKQREQRLEFDKKQIEYGAKNEEIELKKGLLNKTITQEQYDSKLKDSQLKALEDKLALENEYGIQDIDLQQQIEDKKLDLLKSSSNKTKQLIESIRDFTISITQALQQSIESQISALDTQSQRQSQMIDYQKVLAEKGLSNDLAFEERRADELSKKKLEEQKKLRKAKELETFLNSLANFAEQNPNTALAKALGVLAASKAVEALYMEDGGIMGQTSQKSAIGLGQFARRHRSGNDMLVHGERGEGVIPVKKMREWGLTDNGMFSNFLRNPFTAMPIPQSQPVFVNNNADLLAEIKELKEAVKNKPDFFMNVNELNEWVTKEVCNGVATFTTHKRKSI